MRKLIRWIRSEGNPPAVPTKFSRSTEIIMGLAGLLALAAMYLVCKFWLKK